MQEKRGYLTILLSAVLYRFLQKAFSQKRQIHLLTKRRLSYILFWEKKKSTWHPASLALSCNHFLHKQKDSGQTA